MLQWAIDVFSPTHPWEAELASKVLSYWISMTKWRSHPHPHQFWGQHRGSVIEAYYYCFRWKSGKWTLDSFSYIYFWPDQRSCRQPVLTSWFLFSLVIFFFRMVFTPNKLLRGLLGVTEREGVRVWMDRISLCLAINKYMELHRSQWPEISHCSPWWEKDRLVVISGFWVSFKQLPGTQ